MNDPSSHINSSVDSCHIIDLQVFPDENGKLAVIENNGRCPFDIKRMFFLYDVPSGAARGGHSHFEEQQVIIAVTGAFEVRLNDGLHERTVMLSRPNKALYIPAGIWRELYDFTSGAVCVVLSSMYFCEDDYVRDFDTFMQLTEPKR